MEFRKWLEDAGLTHDDYVNKGPYSGLKSKYRTKEGNEDETKEGESKKICKSIKKFGKIDNKLR